MRSSKFPIATVFVAFVVLFGSSVCISGSRVSKVVSSMGSICPYLPWVYASGDKILDSHGKILSLRGFNLLATQRRTEVDYIRLKSWGVTVVRFQIRWDLLEPKPNGFSQSYLQTIDNEIALAKKYGIYVILDMHQWHWSTHFTYFGSTGFGFPTWLCSNHPNTEEGYNRTISDFWSGKGPNGIQPTSSNPSQQDRFIVAWKFVASRYADESTIAAFDLFNEPPRGTLSWTQHASILYPFYEKLITEIRKADARHMLIYEPSNGYATYYARRIKKPNTSISINFYSLRKTYQGDKVALKAAFDSLYNPIKDWHIPFMVTEVGIELSRANSIIWADHTLDILSQYGISWMWFVYGRNDLPGFCVLYANGTEKTEITTIIKPYFELG